MIGPKRLNDRTLRSRTKRNRSISPAVRCGAGTPSVSQCLTVKGYPDRGGSLSRKGVAAAIGSCLADSPARFAHRMRKGGRMTGPFIFIATNRLKPGAYEAERDRVPGLVEFIKGGEPRLLAFNEYVNVERTEVTVVQVHPDA